jgi:hypothetical protein
LHHKRLAFEEEFLYGGDAGAVAAFGSVLAQVRHVDEGRAFQTYIDEGALHARQDAYDLSEVQVADMAALDASFYMELLYGSLFYERDACFEWGDVYKYVFGHGVPASLAMNQSRRVPGFRVLSKINHICGAVPFLLGIHIECMDRSHGGD